MKTFIDTIKNLRTSKAVYKCLVEYGYSVTEQEAAVFFANIHQDGDLAREELANVGQGQIFIDIK